MTMKCNVIFSSLNSICTALEATYSQTGVKTTLIFPQNLHLLKYFSALCIIVPPKRPLTSGFTGCFNHYCGHFTLPFYSVFHVNNTTSSNFSQNDLFLSKFTLVFLKTRREINNVQILEQKYLMRSTDNSFLCGDY